MNRVSLLVLASPVVLAAFFHAACSAEETSVGPGPGTGGSAASAAGTSIGGGTAASGGVHFGGNGTGAASGGAGHGGGTGLSGASDAGFDADFTYTPPEFDASLNPDSACAAESVKAEPVPLDIYFLLDASTSMSHPVGTGASGDCNAVSPFTPANNSRWCHAINAIAGYVSSASAAGNRAALQFFRHYTNHNCNGSGYNTPSVALGTLPGDFSGHAQTLVQQSPGGLNWAYPHNATPTEGALRGLAQFTAANQTPGRIIIGILVTDGIPTSCDTTNATLRGIVQNHFNATGIHTFIVGITGADFTRLENWASYTGALSHDDTNDACGNCNNCTCHHYNVGNGNPAVFIWALEQIQNAVLGCTFTVPQPQQGVLDPELVIVEYLPGGNPPGQELTRVTSAAQCVADGWYYDDNALPTVIQLCPAMCDTVQADPNGEINILLGCQGS